MISRHWRALARAERAAEYVAHLQHKTFPGLRRLPGFLDATILRREQPQGVEFVIITHWVSAAAIRAFSAGDDVEVAVVPAEVRDMMLEYDLRARHYHVIEPLSE
jgi:heme-degrading monooxygenase HmoA